MDFFEVIENRRSIRRYKPEPVAREDVLKVIEAGRLAPSWKNGQCWHYLVVGDQKLKDKLGEITNNNPDVTAYQNAAYVMVLCADPALSGNHNAQSYYLVDAGISMEQCVLAAADLGLGMCWTGIFDEPAVKKLLNIPENIRVVALSPLGVPDQQPKPRPRKNIQDVLFENKWGNVFEK